MSNPITDLIRWFLNGSAEHRPAPPPPADPEPFVPAERPRSETGLYRSERPRAEFSYAPAADYARPTVEGPAPEPSIGRARPPLEPEPAHRPFPATAQPSPGTTPARSAPRPRHWEPPVVGPPIERFAPKPSYAVAYRPDYVADGWTTPEFTVRVASVRGYSHRADGEPRQDDVAVAWHEPTGAVLFAVADGVSSAKLSHVGATSVCRAAISTMVSGLDSADRQVRWDDLLHHAAWQLHEQARLSLGLPEINQRATEEQLATTLVAGLVMPDPDGPQVRLVQAGDSSAWILNTGSRMYRCLTATKFRPGEQVFSNKVDALPRLPQTDVKGGLVSHGEVLLVGTDGFGDPLGSGDNPVGGHFAEALREVPPVLKFANDLDFSQETWDDDRTLFALWPYPFRG